MRRLLILAVCCLVLATGACGGEGQDKGTDEGGKKPAGSTTSTDPKDDKKRVATSSCTVEVSATGAYEAEWRGEGKVRTGGRSPDEPGPKTVYSLTDKKNRLSLYSPGAQFKGSVSLSVGKTVYSSDPADAASLDIDKRGTSAHVDVTLTSIEGHTVDLVADFTCGKPEKKP